MIFFQRRTQIASNLTEIKAERAKKSSLLNAYTSESYYIKMKTTDWGLIKNNE